MSRMYRVAWTAVVLAGGVSVALSGRAFVEARSSARAERQRAEIVVQQVAAMERAKPVAAHWRARRRPPSGLAANLAETVAACGLPATALVNVAAQPETPVQATPGGGGGTGAVEFRRQRAALTLANVTLPQLGAFLEAWRVREPFWTVTTIDVAPERGTGAPAGGGDLPLRVVMTMDAVYLGDPKEERE